MSYEDNVEVRSLRVEAGGLNFHYLAAGSGAAQWLVGAFLLVVLLAAYPRGAFAQDVSLVGVDHVGINVPDLDQAVRFFSDVLGCTPVTLWTSPWRN